MWATVETFCMMYLQVKKWLQLYQHCLAQTKTTHTTQCLNLKRDVSGFHMKRTKLCVCMLFQHWWTSPMNYNILTQLGRDGSQHYVPFCSIIYIKYDSFIWHCWHLCTVFQWFFLMEPFPFFPTCLFFLNSCDRSK